MLARKVNIDFIASFGVIQNLVIEISVIGKKFDFCFINFLKKGTTDALDPITFPYLTTENFVL